MKPSEEPYCQVCEAVQRAGTSKKRLVVCCDGTYTASDTGAESNPSNIALLSRTIAKVGFTKEGSKEIPQVVFYQSGIGTGKMSLASSGFQAAFGGGVNEKISAAYNFLVNNYSPGDEILLFGFSRGAYTARSLAGFICQVGLLTPGMMDYFNQIYNVYKKRGDATCFAETKWAQTTAKRGELGLDASMYPGETMTRIEYIRRWAHFHVKIKAVGCFDTVGSLGMSGWVDQPGTDTMFHSTKLHPKIEHAFHALALDETRGNFPPTLFYLDEKCREAGVTLRQCWFPGYHGDIGGNAIAWTDTNSMNEITFAWMVDQLERDQLLQFDKNALNYPILRRLTKLEGNAPGGLPPTSHEEVNSRRVQWSDGSFSLMDADTLFWQAASMLTTWRPNYQREPGVYYAKDGASQVEYTHFNEEIHPSVYHRILARPKGWYAYKPPSLHGWTRQPDGDGKGFSWAKEESRQGLISWLKGEDKQMVRLKEYQIPKLEERDSHGHDHWTGSLERMLAPQDYLAYLDKAWEEGEKKDSHRWLLSA